MHIFTCQSISPHCQLNDFRCSILILFFLHLLQHFILSQCSFLILTLFCNSLQLPIQNVNVFSKHLVSFIHLNFLLSVHILLYEQCLLPFFFFLRRDYIIFFNDLLFLVIFSLKLCDLLLIIYFDYWLPLFISNQLFLDILQLLNHNTHSDIVWFKCLYFIVKFIFRQFVRSFLVIVRLF